jgi:hypothetical protein
MFVVLMGVSMFDGNVKKSSSGCSVDVQVVMRPQGNPVWLSARMTLFILCVH